VFAHGRHAISAVVADREDAGLLGVEPGAPLLRQLRRATSAAGEPLEWSDDRYRGDAVSFTIDNADAAGRALAAEAGSRAA
jgi:GntR family transcriptional regulator